ncbi:MAG: anaerobic C4-dicarboxylate transporter family protein [Sutterella wadsworthensis]
MLFISMLMYWFCDVELTKIKNSSIFKGGYESLVVILGICWLASTVIGIYIPTIKEQATVLLGQYPGLLALAFFCVSALLFSQGATSALLVPVAASLGCDAPMILACFVAVSGIFVTNVYPTSAFAISCDDTGSFKGKWSGTYVINHPFSSRNMASSPPSCSASSWPASCSNTRLRTMESSLKRAFTFGRRPFRFRERPFSDIVPSFRINSLCNLQAG